MASSIAAKDAFNSIYLFQFRGRNICRGRNAVSVRASQATHNSRQRRSQNIDGEFFVDRRCIDCDSCRWIAPKTFTRVEEQSAVFQQPSCEEERLQALQALLCCPTASIHTEKLPRDILEVHKTFPLPINEQRIPSPTSRTRAGCRRDLPDPRRPLIPLQLPQTRSHYFEGVYLTGYHSEKSYGATPYLIVHPEGNILVDSPSYKERLAHNIEMLGGARYMFLTHKDDVGDHEKWSKRLKCDRILHSQDVEGSTAAVEMKLHGDGPWSLGSDFELIYTPGHSEGSVCLFYKPLKILFTGDHLALSQESEFTIFEEYNYCSVQMQLESVRKLMDLDFEWILPGHGRRVEFGDTQEKNSALEAFLASKEQTLLQLA